MDLWKKYQLKKQKNDRLKDINCSVNSGEDRNEILLRVKETKSFLLDSIYYFNNNSQEKLRIFLEKYEQLENSRQHDYVNMCLKKENEKYETNNNKEKKESKMNEDLRQTQFIPQNSKRKEELKNVIIPENRKIEENSIKETEKDNNDSLNTRFDFKITQKVRKEIIKNNNRNINFEKIPLDNKKKEIILNNNDIINKNNEINNNIKIQSFDNFNNQNYNKQFNNNIKNENIIVKNMNIINNNNINNIINMNQNTNRITNITINKRTYNCMTPKGKINQNNNYDNKIVNYKNRMINNNNIYKIPQPKDTIIEKPCDSKNIKNISFDNKNSNNNYLKEQNYIVPQDFQKIKTFRNKDNNNINLKQGFQVYKIPSYRSIFDENSNI